MQFGPMIASARRRHPRLPSLRLSMFAVVATVLWSAIAWTAVDRHFQDVTDDYLKRERLNAERDLRLMTLGLTQNSEAIYGVMSGLARQDSMISALRHVDELQGNVNAVRLSDDPQLQALSRSLFSVVGDLKIMRNAYLVDRRGICIAASNDRSGASPVGIYYGDRAYVTASMQGSPASEFALARTNNQPALFLSIPVRKDGGIIGVLAARIDGATLAPWINAAEYLLADENGVIMLARDEDLVLKTLPGSRISQMSRQDRLERYRRDDFIALTQQSDTAPLHPDMIEVKDRTTPALLATLLVPSINATAGVLRWLPQLTMIAREREDMLLRLWTIGMLGLAVGLALLWRQSNLGHGIREAERVIRLHQAAIDAATQAIAVYRADGFCLAANDAMLRLLGLRREQTADHNFRTDSLWLESGLVGAANQVVEIGVPQRSHWRLNLSFGSEIWIEAALKRFVVDGGPCLLAIFSEVTDQHSRETKRP